MLPVPVTCTCHALEAQDASMSFGHTQVQQLQVRRREACGHQHSLLAWRPQHLSGHCLSCCGRLLPAICPGLPCAAVCIPPTPGRPLATVVVHHASACSLQWSELCTDQLKQWPPRAGVDKVCKAILQHAIVGRTGVHPWCLADASAAATTSTVQWYKRYSRSFGFGQCTSAHVWKLRLEF